MAPSKSAYLVTPTADLAIARPSWRFQGRHHEPPLGASGVDQLLSGEAGPGAQVGEVAFRRSSPISVEVSARHVYRRSIPLLTGPIIAGVTAD